MTGIIAKTWNTYKRHDGYVMAWDRHDTGEGHSVTMLDSEGETTSFRWRNTNEPTVGHRVSVIMVEEGVTTRKTRPVLVLDHDTGLVLREQNAPPPRGTRPIMIGLSIWMLVAMAISGAIIANTQGLAMVVLTLIATAFLVWRLAIATSEIRMDERAQVRISDEEKLCLDIMTSEWRLSANQAIDLKRVDAE